MRKLLRKGMKRSQGMTEYIIIVGLIAIVLIVAVKSFGLQINTGFEKGEAKIKKDVIKAIDGNGGGGTGSGGTGGAGSGGTGG
jgi:Flp pilus assembly pilin Flp